jgi:hypothetical protein
VTVGEDAMSHDEELAGKVYSGPKGTFAFAEFTMPGQPVPILDARMVAALCDGYMVMSAWVESIPPGAKTAEFPMDLLHEIQKRAKYHLRGCNPAALAIMAYVGREAVASMKARGMLEAITRPFRMGGKR